MGGHNKGAADRGEAEKRGGGCRRAWLPRSEGGREAQFRGEPAADPAKPQSTRLGTRSRARIALVEGLGSCSFSFSGGTGARHDRVPRVQAPPSGPSHLWSRPLLAALISQMQAKHDGDRDTSNPPENKAEPLLASTHCSTHRAAAAWSLSWPARC